MEKSTYGRAPMEGTVEDCGGLWRAVEDCGRQVPAWLSMEAPTSEVIGDRTG